MVCGKAELRPDCIGNEAVGGRGQHQRIARMAMVLQQIQSGLQDVRLDEFTHILLLHLAQLLRRHALDGLRHKADIHAHIEPALLVIGIELLVALFNFFGARPAHGIGKVRPGKVRINGQ